MNPAEKEPVIMPSAANRNREPALPELMCMSALMSGNRGEKTKRLTKFRKNREVRKTIVPATALKGNGVGQVFTTGVRVEAIWVSPCNYLDMGGCWFSIR